MIFTREHMIFTREYMIFTREHRIFTEVLCKLECNLASKYYGNRFKSCLLLKIFACGALEAEKRCLHLRWRVKFRETRCQNGYFYTRRQKIYTRATR